jgi:hypothetical protein
MVLLAIIIVEVLGYGGTNVDTLPQRDEGLVAEKRQQTGSR